MIRKLPRVAVLLCFCIILGCARPEGHTATLPETAPSAERTEATPAPTPSVPSATDFPVVELSYFQKSVLRDVFDNSRRISRRRGIVGKWLDTEQPIYLFSAVLSWAHAKLTSDEDGSTGRAPIKVFGHWRDPLPGYPSGIELDGTAEVTRQEASRDARCPAQRAQWAEAIRSDGVYRPTTYVCRMTEAADYDDLVRAECPERVVWYVSSDDQVVTPLSILASTDDRAASAQKYSDDLLVISSTGLDIRVESPLPLSELDEVSIAELMWWRFGEYVGVASGFDPRAVLLLLPGTRFAFGKGQFQVRSMKDNEISLEVNQIVNPYFRE